MSEAHPLHRNRARANSFGAVAEAYDATRPSYPDAFLDDLLAAGPKTALDVGCGTGILARQLAGRGLEVLGVEPDERMAQVARSHGLAVEVATIEQWDPRSRRFDLLTSGQAWHWVDPALGAAKAAECVAGGGTVALVWNIGALPEDLARVFDTVYAELAPSHVRPIVPHSTPTDDEPAERELVATGAFELLGVRTYPWRHTYTTAEWLGQLGTHSDHRLMDPAELDRLLRAVGSAIDDAGGSFEMSYSCEASLLRRLPT